MGRLIWSSQILCLCFILLHFQAQCLSISPNSPPHLCHPREYFALLAFKTTISVRNCSGYVRNSIQSWNESIDCCLWKGITCNKMTGHVVGLDLSESCVAVNMISNSSLFLLEKLQSLNLGGNYFIYPNISFGLQSWKNLRYLNLTGSRLIHSSLLFEISLLSKLVSLDLSYNHDLLIDNTKFQLLVHNLTGLRFLFLDFVNVSLVLPSSLLNLTSSLEQLSLGNCSLQGNFPIQVFQLPSLRLLDLSHNYDLGGNLPKSNWSSPLKYLSLINTSFSGELPHLIGNLKLLDKLFLDCCQFYGSIPSSFCNLTSLSVLGLANNNLGEKIPNCLGSLSELSILVLRRNYFDGRIPNLFVNHSRLRTLNLNGNQLEGRLPRCLVNCSDLEVLDVGNNYLNDIFPHWLGVLASLQVLILRFNQFRGAINNSTPTFYFPQLRIIDISQNNFMGLLPTNYFKILKGMIDVHGDEAKLEYIEDSSIYYEDSVKLVMKGSEVEVVRILKIFTTLDFSSNRFHGPILEELGELSSLLLLNLSHNNLTGQIPSSFGKMKELESLDLSSNKLEGKIPEQLTNLTFLSVLKLSHNDLVGQIPQGKRFNTFSNDSYIGNSGLCGFPLTKKCHEEEPVKNDSATLFEWKFALAGYGCGLVLGLSLGYIAFTIGKPWWVVKKVEKYQQKFVGRCNGKHKKRKTQKSNQHS